MRSCVDGMRPFSYGDVFRWGAPPSDTNADHQPDSATSLGRGQDRQLGRFDPDRLPET